MIIRKEALKFGAFPLKLHETKPNEPLSPYFFNIRSKDNPGKKGPLVAEDYDLIAKALLTTAEMVHLKLKAIAGLPHAADPIIAAIERAIPEPRDFRIIKLAKHVTRDYRKIIPAEGFEYRQGEEVLLIDDLVTQAHSKIEAANAIKSGGSVVKNVLVLIDREQGGKRELEKAGYNLIACFTITDLSDYYLSKGMISSEKHAECIEYTRNNQA
jgi:uridine monophosphate synthetase